MHVPGGKLPKRGPQHQGLSPKSKCLSRGYPQPVLRCRPRQPCEILAQMLILACGQDLPQQGYEALLWQRLVCLFDVLVVCFQLPFVVPFMRAVDKPAVQEACVYQVPSAHLVSRGCEQPCDCTLSSTLPRCFRLAGEYCSQLKTDAFDNVLLEPEMMDTPVRRHTKEFQFAYAHCQLRTG